MVVNAIAQCVHLARHFNKANSVTVFLAIESFFISTEVFVDLDTYLAGLFIAAMASLIVGLLCFLREVHLSKGVINDYES